MELDAKWVLHCYETIYCAYEGAVRYPANVFS